MQAKVGVFGRGMASVKIQYFVEGQLYSHFKGEHSRHCHFAAYCPRLMWQVPALSLLVYVPHACLAEVLRHQAATRTCAISELQRANACK